MEIGTPGIKSTPDGWLNRYLKETAKSDTVFRGVALSAQMPRILAGSARALTLASVDEFRLRNEQTASLVQRIYSGTTDPIFRSGGENLFAAMNELNRIRAQVPPSAEVYPAGRFGVSLSQIARLIKSGAGVEIAFTEIEGWDTHVNQGGATGQMANRLKELAEGLAAFHRDLGDRMADVVLVTMSEFGRTARENGNRGTDHGHANVMFAMGGPVRGGKVYGRWPGLAPESLNEGRDLALTTDFRTVYAEVLKRHLGQTDLSRIFPGFRVPAPLGLIG
jgi:uncharacterized protein (DUF1501 family)